jgi:glycosyltransferase involved in cell wall biosynthesis
VRRGELDLVEVPDYPGFLPFGVPGCATVVRLHQSATVSHRLAGLKTSPGMYFYEKQTLAANRDWIAVSTHILSLTEGAFGISPRKFAVIHNGIVAAKEEMGTVPNLPAHFVLYAGQVSRRKGSLVLAEAAREFLPRHPDIHLVYAGGCLPEAGVPPIDDTITQIVGTDLAARVHFLGQLTREQVLSCMHRAAVFAFPALIDCFPLVVLEAMTAGVPVVFTRNPPGPEMIEDGVSGLLADPTAPLDFSEKIGRLLDDKKLAARLGAQGQARVASRFSLEQCVQATEQFYGECLRDARSRLQITDSPTAWNQPQPNTSLSPRLETKKPA